MTERINKELAMVRAVYGDIDIDPNFGWFVIREWGLAAGWNKSHTRLLVLIPPGYAVTSPDNFFTDPDLKLAGGGLPGNASPALQLEQQWLQFSYHIEAGDWQPENGHTLLTFLAAVTRRLQENS